MHVCICNHQTCCIRHAEDVYQRRGKQSLTVHVCMYICMYVRMYVCTYVRMYVGRYVCMHVCMYACMYVCMYTTGNSAENDSTALHNADQMLQSHM